MGTRWIVFTTQIMIWAAPTVGGQEFHTSPYCWEEPRIYASGSDTNVEVSIARPKQHRDFDGEVSQNGAYAFEISDQDSDALTSPKLRIWTERSYLLEVRFPAAKAISTVEWLNENLVYARLWWGNVAGSDFVIDVEEEAVVYQQPIRYGAIAFEQFKQCADPAFRDQAQCQCEGDLATSTDSARDLEDVPSGQ